MYAEKEPTVKRSEAVLNDLLGNLFTIGADDKITVLWTVNLTG